MSQIRSRSDLCMAPLKILKNVRLACVGERAETVDHGLLAWNGETIVFAGAAEDFPAVEVGRAHEVIDAKGAWLTPGLIDCHTHAVFAGNRAEEFVLRQQGLSYAELAARGGGIMSTVNHTRAASEDELLESASRRLQCFIDEGVTTIEIKSGYGLTLESERTMLTVAAKLRQRLPIDVKRTYLGLHSVPAERKSERAGFLDEAIDLWLPRLHSEGLIDAVDAYCEHLAFSADECARLFQRAQQLGLPVKLHAEQLSDVGGSRMAAAHRALSVDHVEYLSATDIPALRAAGTVAVLIPAAFVVLKETQKPPIAELRAQQVPMAIASDLNPGTSPVQSLRLAMNLASTVFELSYAEALAGVTVHAARALGLHDRGLLAAGKRADFCLWKIDALSELAYWWGGNLLERRFFGGSSG
jgi:imidazolonepropionase